MLRPGDVLRAAASPFPAFFAYLKGEIENAGGLIQTPILTRTRDSQRHYSFLRRAGQAPAVRREPFCNPFLFGDVPFWLAFMRAYHWDAWKEGNLNVGVLPIFTQTLPQLLTHMLSAFNARTTWADVKTAPYIGTSRAQAPLPTPFPWWDLWQDYLNTQPPTPEAAPNFVVRYMESCNADFQRVNTTNTCEYYGPGNGLRWNWPIINRRNNRVLNVPYVRLMTGLSDGGFRLGQQFMTVDPRVLWKVFNTERNTSWQMRRFPGDRGQMHFTWAFWAAGLPEDTLPKFRLALAQQVCRYYNHIIGLSRPSRISQRAWDGGLRESFTDPTGLSWALQAIEAVEPARIAPYRNAPTLLGGGYLLPPSPKSAQAPPSISVVKGVELFVESIVAPLPAQQTPNWLLPKVNDNDNTIHQQWLEARSKALMLKEQAQLDPQKFIRVQLRKWREALAQRLSTQSRGGIVKDFAITLGPLTAHVLFEPLTFKVDADGFGRPPGYYTLPPCYIMLHLGLFLKNFLALTRFGMPWDIRTESGDYYLHPHGECQSHGELGQHQIQLACAQAILGRPQDLLHHLHGHLTTRNHTGEYRALLPSSMTQPTAPLREGELIPAKRVTMAHARYLNMLTRDGDY